MALCIWVWIKIPVKEKEESGGWKGIWFQVKKKTNPKLIISIAKPTQLPQQRENLLITRTPKQKLAMQKTETHRVETPLAALCPLLPGINPISLPTKLPPQVFLTPQVLPQQKLNQPHFTSREKREKKGWGWRREISERCPKNLKRTAFVVLTFNGKWSETQSQGLTRNYVPFRFPPLVYQFVFVQYTKWQRQRAAFTAQNAPSSSSSSLSSLPWFLNWDSRLSWQSMGNCYLTHQPPLIS